MLPTTGTENEQSPRIAGTLGLRISLKHEKRWKAELSYEGESGGGVERKDSEPPSGGLSLLRDGRQRHGQIRSNHSLSCP